VTSPARQLINGTWEDGDTLVDVTNPADGTIVGKHSWGSAVDATRAVDAAAKAFGGWAELPPRRRADTLLEASRLITERTEEIGTLLAREAGKRLPEALGEVSFSAEYFRWFAEQARRPSGEVIPHEAADRRHLTFRRPVGVVASLTPWNFPCSIQARKLAPALAAGCTVVARVSEKAPLAATLMVQAIVDAGVPAGVINLVHGPARELTQALLDHEAVRAVTFTGSTPVGREIMARASQRVVRPLLELGGDAAFIVFEDADVDAAVEGAMIAKFRNSGQSCIAANRFIVHDRVYDRFVDAFVAQVDAMSVGDGLSEPCPDLGPVIDASRVDAVSSLVDQALAQGATRLTKDAPVPGHGTYLSPTLLADVPDTADIARQEVFGPAAAIFRFHDTEQALERANATEMGLAGYLWSRDVSRCWKVAERLEAGILGVNNALPSVAFAPMGGVKQSGLGREGAAVGLEEFEDIRYLALGL
jgi:succinate-semialdehyde dehydrogenase/glutarate-semialdehyde dehydrogenase